MKMKNTHKLVASLLMDAFGYFSYVIPGVGEVTDALFAPIQAAYIFWAYKSTKFAILGFAEEIAPGFDFIPSCTIAHFMTDGGTK